MSLLTITGLSMTKEVAFNESSISVLLQEEALLRELQGILIQLDGTDFSNLSASQHYQKTQQVTGQETC